MPAIATEKLESTIDMSTRLIRSREACAMLGVKPATLYTYVSRGVLRAVRVGRGRARLYVVDDVARIAARSAARRGHGAVAAGALRWGEPVLESAITSVSGGVLAYRGRRVDALVAAGVPFEQVANLLWQRPDDEAWELGAADPALELPRAAPTWRMAAAVPALALRDPARWGRAEAAEIACARRLIAALASALGGRPAGGSIAARAARALGARADGAPLVDRALVAIADHELNASTFAARVAASAGADLYAALGAALYTATGPRHAGAADRIAAFVDELPRHGGGVARVVAARLARGDAVPGFGHPLYPDGDPRAPILLAPAFATRAPSRTASARLSRLRALLDAGAALTGAHPSVDLALVAVVFALDLAPGAATALFALGRTAGWVAHILEQRRSPELLRPRARYVGPAVG